MIKKNKLAFTLVEITVALGIFALLAIPAYMLFSYSASSENEYHKTAAALRIIESYRDEVKNLSYKIVDEMGTSLTPEAQLILEKEHDKFGIESPKIEKSGGHGDIIKLTITVTWKNRSGKEMKETQTFVKVK